MNLYTWHPMSEPPTKSGAYLCAHRGWAKVRYFLGMDNKRYAGTKTGWIGDMSFAPTHWMGFTDPPDGPNSVTERMAAINQHTAMVREDGGPAYGILQ